MLRASLIIPLHRPTPAFRRCVERALAVAGERHEVIVVTDRPVEAIPAGVKVVLTGAEADTSPAEKRDAALGIAAGDVYAFLDDDAYPAEDWLERALARFDDPDVAAVGGPGLTPPGSPFRERASGAFYESPFGSGTLRSRFRPVGSMRPVDDWPAYNFLVRREALRAVGGWASRYYGGEDTKLCLALRDAGFRIVYDPEVVVYHHRRPIFRPHLRQVGNVGRHRGYFVRAFPGTSRRLTYFLPSLAVAAAAVGVAWAGRRPRGRRLVAGAALTGAAAISGHAVRDGEDARVAAVLPAVVAATHLVYAVQFARGLAGRPLAR